MMLIATSCVQQVSVNLMKSFCPGNPTTNVLGPLLQTSVFLRISFTEVYVGPLSSHFSSASPETIAFISQEM